MKIKVSPADALLRSQAECDPLNTSEKHLQDQSAYALKVLMRN
jgi:hypothetical protein